MQNVAAIGAGYWAKNMLRSIDANERTRLMYVCDVNESALRTVASLYPNTKTTCRIEDILQDQSIHAVYVATPPSSHYEIAANCIRANKHVLIEKPMTTDLAQARELVQLAREHGVTLMVGHTFLYSPPVRKIKDLIQNGTMGDVFYINSMRVNLGKLQESGVMWDLAPHDLSILMYWLGEVPTHVTVSGRPFVNQHAEDVAFVSLCFPRGTLAQIHLSWLSPVKLRQITVSGSQRMVVYNDTDGPESVRVYNHGVDRREPDTYGEYQLSYRQGDIWIPRVENTEPLSNEWNHFIDCVEQNLTPLSDATQGMSVVAVMEAAQRALRSGITETVSV